MLKHVLDTRLSRAVPGCLVVAGLQADPRAV